MPNLSVSRQLFTALTAGTQSAEAAVRHCLSQIETNDSRLRSFAVLRAEDALAEARWLDTQPRKGPMHGVPFAAKDVFATRDLPTEYNSPYYAGHQPASDAAAVELLRQGGGVLIGKLATVEFAGIGALPDTRNPFNQGHTPGGSSAGSGAAVGAGLVPLALATQTGGSTIRPASFCGAAGFKPTWGRVSVEGMKPFAPELDTVGWIACSVAALHAVARCYGLVTDECNEDNLESSDQPAASLKIGLYQTPYWQDAAPETRQALHKTAELLERHGHSVETVDGPDGADALNQWQDVLMFGQGRSALLAEYQRDAALAHPEVRDLVENAKGYTSAQWVAARDHIARFRPQFDAAMEGFDGWLCPAVPGEAPLLSEGNGLATFNRLFTALHLPCVTLPGFFGPNGLPVGVQLIAPRFADQQLLASAAVVEQLIFNQSG